MKAIPTAYKGYLFRSRLEARWAVFLDSFREEWEYEKEGYELPSGRYLPDFWLPRLGLWLEIKGEEPKKQEIELCADLGEETDRPVAIAWGIPTSNPGRLKVYCFDYKDSTAGTGWWPRCFWSLDTTRNLCICSSDDMSRDYMSPQCGNDFPGMKQVSQISCPIPEFHINAAKSARFEHGETP